MIAKKFEEQVKKTPHKVAVKDRDISITYHKLNAYADRIAYSIRQAWPAEAKEDTVGLLFDHGLDMIAAILGTLKAGKIYVPLSSDYPKNRLFYMLTNSRSSLILTNTACEPMAGELAEENHIPLLNINNSMENPLPGENPNRGINGEKLAYIMYTSGSTGRPKGVTQNHDNVLYYIRNWTHWFSITETDRMTLFSSFCHDGSGQDMFGALFNGATLYPLNMKNRDNTGELSRFLVRERITIWHSVPSLYSYFVNSLEESGEFKDLRFILLGGEPIREHDVEMFKRFFPHSVLANVYGQTESSVDSIWLIRPQDSFRKLIIGAPLDRTDIFVVGEEGEEVGELEMGEIVVACPHLSPGYWQDPEATEKTFSMDPELGKLYWTGDLGRLLLDGNIEFMGRKDAQVKIRGFRVEPGEIESYLLKHPHIDEAVVIAREDNQGDKYLCAYVVSQSPGWTENVSELRTFLAQDLPDYMIPLFFVRLERFLLTQSGKIDRRALPEPEIRPTETYVAPGSEMERKLVELWAGVLNQPSTAIGIDDNFFDLGGHSLKASILAARMHRELDVRINLSRVFETPTIRDLARYIQGIAKDKYAAVEPVEQKDYYALSPAQTRLYILQQMELQSTGYNMPTVVELEGDLEREKLKQTFMKLIRRHESLRTSFHMMNEEPVQRIHKKENSKLQIPNYKAPAGHPIRIPNYKSQITKMIQNFVCPFDLSQAPLLRVGLIQLTEETYILMTDMHHIVSDGTSKLILVREFMELYGGGDLTPLQIHYKDFSDWQNRTFARGHLRNQEIFWLKEFAGEIPVLDLPYDYPRPAVQSFEGASVSFELGETEREQLKQMAVEERGTVYMVLLAMFYVFLSKVSGQEDIVVATPTAGRPHADLQRIIGIFVNTLALRNFPAAEKTFREFLKELRNRTLQAFENQEYQFEELVEKAGVRRDASRNPLFDVMFMLQNFEVREEAEAGNVELREMELKGLKVKPYPFENRATQFDLTFAAVETGDKLYFRVDYCTRLFRQETVHRLIGFFKQVVSIVLADPEKQLFAVEVMSDEERKRILYDFNDTDAEYPHSKTLHELFEEKAETTPDRIAVVGLLHHLTYRTYRTYLTYKTLNKKSNQLAHLLKEKGVKTGSIVALMLERSVEMVIGLFGILKAGGAYLPIDPGYPEHRINYMLADSGAKILSTNLPEGHLLFNCQLLMSSLEATLHHSSFINHHSGLLAYVIYTSGSTGKPKGVMIEHRSVVNFVEGMAAKIVFTPGETILASTTISFDIFVLEVFLPLLKGLKVVIAGEDEQRDPLLLEALILRNRVRMVQVTPSRLKLLLNSPGSDDCLNQIETLMVGGEALPEHLFKSLKSKFKGKLYNLYGPTETTVWSTLKDLTGEESIDIGKPIANTQIFIVNPYSRLQPVGIAGELCIGGDGVARGYLNNPELTSEKFFSSSLLRFSASQLLSFSLYRTGDLARWLPDPAARGAYIIEFLGRTDYQVKIRGFRIELEEIEELLLNYQGIKEAVVIAGEDKEEKYLCAYVVPFVSDLPGAELREYLSQKLPDYMIPSYFMQLEELPLTPNGKVDRKSLPAPEIKGSHRYTPPRDEVEETLMKIWSDVLTVGEGMVGIDDNFFELGGHSLRAAVMMSRIHKELDVVVPLGEIFKTPFIRGIAVYIKRSAKDKYAGISPVEKQDYYPVSSAQKRLYILQQMERRNTGYNLPTIVELEGELDAGKLEQTFRKLIRRHESLRTSFHMMNKEPVQRIHKDVVFKLESHVAWSMEHGAWDRDSLHTPYSMPHVSFVCPFDLALAPLLRVGLIEVEEHKHIFMTDMHHIIADGISKLILVREFMQLYNEGDLPPLRIHYKDFSQWQKQGFEKGYLKTQESFWLKEFAGEIPVLELPYDYPRPVVQSFAGSSLQFELGTAETGQLKQEAAAQNVTLYMVLLAIFDVFLSKTSGQEDIVVGTPLAGRRHADLAGIIGNFVNTLVLRNHPTNEKKFNEFLREVKERTVQAFENQEYPFEDLVDKVDVTRDASRNPLFDTVLVLQNFEVRDTEEENAEIQEMEIKGLTLKPYEWEITTAKFDLNFTAVETENNLRFRVEYCTKLFKEETVQRFIGFFKRVVSIVSAEPEKMLCEIEIINEEEKRQLLFDFNDTNTNYPRTETLQQLFEEQEKRAPDRMAVAAVLDHSTYRTYRTYMTYKTLNEKSNQLAHLLIEKGVKPDHIVALLLERSVEMVMAILGILKAGGAYLPIDPDYPENRINYMLADSGARVLVTDSLSEGCQFNCQLSIVNCQLLMIGEAQPATCNPQPATSLAYIIYTSGTTGKPKGVMIEHRNVVRLMFNDRFQFDFGSSDVWTLFHSYCFDFSVWEMYGALLYGGKLVIIPKMTARDPGAFLKVLVEKGVTVLNQTPAAFYQLVDEELKQLSKALHLKYVIFGGEALKPIKLKKWKERYPDTKLINMFGITETTVHVTFKEITEKEIAANKSNVGKPIPTLSTYIMDKHQGLLAIGVPGELCVGGAGVGRGYLNRAELTMEKFVENPYKPGERLYRSGDLLKLSADGEMEYLGRIDQQVQVRGFRVELGEVENRLLNHQDIKEVVVREVDKSASQKHLSAYIVSEKELEVSGLRSYLSKDLPDYMIPAYFVQLEKIPLTSNGKVDRKILPQPEAALGQARYVAPKSDMEKMVANSWSEVLELDKVGVRDNFFEIGGNSLSVVQVIGKLRDVLNRDIPVVILFEYPTVDALAQYLSKEVNDGSLPDDELERADIMDKGKDRRKQRMKKSKEF